MADTRRGKIRWLELEDMPETAALEALCFPSFWTVEQFTNTWKLHWFAGYGLFRGSRLIGYITLSILAGELEVLNIALHPEERGLGYSRPLMRFALEDTLNGGHLSRRGEKPEGWASGVLEVRTGNIPARTLYSGLGFVSNGVRKHYYSDGEDAVVMTVTAENFRKILRQGRQR